jgi:hypothetical protein
MPVQKDFKRLVRDRMTKTGESYTAARLQLLKKTNPHPTTPRSPDERCGDHDQDRPLVGEWVRVLDRERAADKPHREIALFVSSLGTPDGGRRR